MVVVEDTDGCAVTASKRRAWPAQPLNTAMSAGWVWFPIRHGAIGRVKNGKRVEDEAQNAAITPLGPGWQSGGPHQRVRPGSRLPGRQSPFQFVPFRRPVGRLHHGSARISPAMARPRA